jgi:hypothetical protein
VVRPVLAWILWAGAIAVPAQVGGDDREMLRESIGDLVPGDMRQRIAVEQEQRRPVAAFDVVDPGPGCLEIAGSEPPEHRISLLHPTVSPG